MKSIVNSGGPVLVRKMALLLLGACILCLGCKSSRSSSSGSQTIWSSEAISPDGKMIATAVAVAPNGIGLTISTQVYLNWTTGSQSRTPILELGDASDSPIDTTVEMKWLSPARLELTYAGNRVLGFQAAKWAGVEISVQTVPSEGSKPAQ